MSDRIESKVVKMNPEVKARWVEALRSGRYAQGRARLVAERDGTTYCCLGVLCDILGVPYTVHDGIRYYGGPGAAATSDSRGEQYILPPQACTASGLPSRPVVRWRKGDRPMLSGEEGIPLDILNDINGMSFLDIAARIEVDL